MSAITERCFDMVVHLVLEDTAWGVLKKFGRLRSFVTRHDAGVGGRKVWGDIPGAPHWRVAQERYPLPVAQADAPSNGIANLRFG